MALPPDPLTKKQLHPSNGEKLAGDTAKEGKSNRLERRKDWWQKKKSAAKESRKSESSKDDPEDKGQRVKLRKFFR